MCYVECVAWGTMMGATIGLKPGIKMKKDSSCTRSSPKQDTRLFREISCLENTLHAMLCLNFVSSQAAERFTKGVPREAADRVNVQQQRATCNKTSSGLTSVVAFDTG